MQRSCVPPASSCLCSGERPIRRLANLSCQKGRGVFVCHDQKGTEMSDDRVIIFDTTLRDGEQSPGISLDAGEKLEIAEQLSRLGVDYIEAGFPVASQGDFEAVRTIARTVQGPAIAGLSRTQIADVDRCWDAV